MHRHGHGHGHGHDHAGQGDAALEASAAGTRAVKVSLAALGATAALQLLAVVPTRSVALFGDTLHNLADAATALPLWLAFGLGRRQATRRYTYGYGRAEDLAGVAVVVAIAASAVVTVVAAVARLRSPVELRALPLVMVAALVGLTGNELVAAYRIRVGRRIGSAALVADGLHARADGLTSLAVLAGALGVRAGWWWADPVVALVIGAAILLVMLQAGRQVLARLMDAVDPAMVEQAEAVAAATPGVGAVGGLRLRWVGHRLDAEARITVARDLSVVEAHDISEEVHHRLLHELPWLRGAVVHADPAPDGPAAGDPHARTAHHFGQVRDGPGRGG